MLVSALCPLDLTQSRGPGKCGVEWICLDVYRDVEQECFISSFACLRKGLVVCILVWLELFLLQPLGAGITHRYHYSWLKIQSFMELIH